MTPVKTVWVRWLFSHPLSHPAHWWQNGPISDIAPFYPLLKLNFFHDTHFQLFILFILGKKYWKERSAGRDFSTMETWLQEWCTAEQWMEVETLILFNQGTGEGTHHKWAHWWLLSWGLMYPLPSIHIYFFRLCALKEERVCYTHR